MHGNVWEWCSDRFDVNYFANSPVSDPQGAPAGSSFVVRGGGFDDTPVALRCAYRNFGVDPSWRSYHFGFRVVCE
jgi:formylglycine-generating enzyme required for sulfatase activity